MAATERIYYDDAYLARFRARVTAVDQNKVYLDRTAFYPTSGGQPFDVGTIAGALVRDVVDEGERIAHLVDGAMPEVGAEVACEIDWTRRRDHMQQHTGQHLLSAVLEALFGAKTVSFHLGVESSTIDVDSLGLTAEQLAQAEERANEVIQENRPTAISYEDAAEADGLRKESKREGTLRIISIDSLDRSACGGTHVRATGEIGALFIRKTEKIRNTLRIEFLCGMRAVRRARADYASLSAAARVFSSPLDQVPALAETQAARLVDAGKMLQKLEVELATEAGRKLYSGCQVGPVGLRLQVERVAALDERVRARAQGFSEGARSLFLAVCAAGPSYLMSASADSGVNATEWMKANAAEFGLKGGGSPAMAQGRAISAEALDALEAKARLEFAGQ